MAKRVAAVGHQEAEERREKIGFAWEAGINKPNEGVAPVRVRERRGEETRKAAVDGG